MTVCKTDLPFDFPQPRPLSVQFSDLELSSDAGLLLGRQADERLGLTAALASCIQEWRDPAKVTHSLAQLVQQRVYQINEASSGYPLVLQLRPGNSHPGKGVAGLLRWLFWRLRRAWPGVQMTLRADSGFSLPEIVRVCERAGVSYALGYSCNAVLKDKIQPLLEQSRVVACLSETGKARLFDDAQPPAGRGCHPLGPRSGRPSALEPDQNCRPGAGLGSTHPG